MYLPHLSWATASLLVAAMSHAPAPVLAAPICEHFSRADTDAYVEVAVRTLGNLGSSLEDKDYAVRLLRALDKSSVASGYKSSACSTATAAVLSGDLGQIHHGISLAAGVGGCSSNTAKVVESAIEQVAETVHMNHDILSLYHATLAAPHFEVDVSGGRVLDKVLDLVESDSSVRSFPGGPTADGNVFMAVELLSVLIPPAKGTEKDIALAQVERIKDSVLESQPALLVQLNKAHGQPLSIKVAKLKFMARELLEASRTSRPKSMLGVYEALKAIEAYPKAPLSIKLVPSSPCVEELSSGNVALLVTSLLGSPVSMRAASLSKLARADGSDALGSGTDGGSPLGAPSPDGFRALPSVEVAAGLYTAEFSVEVEGGGSGKALTAKLPVAVGSTAVLTEARVTVGMTKDISGGDSDGTGDSLYILAPGETLPNDARASTLDGHYLHVRLSLMGGAAAAAAAPHQVFVRFTHVTTGLDTFFVAAPVVRGSSGSGGTGGGGAGGGGASSEFSVSISLGEESATFLQRSGAYDVAVLVGGPLVTPPVLEKLGAIELDFPVTKARDWPIYARALLHETDVSLGALPEKHHTFREPEVRPHAGVSVLFTLFVLAPLAGLAYGMRRGGADLKKLPGSSAGRCWCAAHQACMVAIVLLFVTYWCALTMAFTLKVLSVLSLVTTVTGRKALQSIAVEAVGAEEGAGAGKSAARDHTKEE